MMVFAWSTSSVYDYSVHSFLFGTRGVRARTDIDQRTGGCDYSKPILNWFNVAVGHGRSV